MLGRLTEVIPSLFKNKQESSLVLEQLDNHLEATFARVGEAGKKVFVKIRKTVKDFDKLRKPFFLLDKIIVGLGSTRATTVESVIHLRRPKSEAIINETELDHLVFRALWEFLNHYRGWAAKKMGITELDVILAHIEIRDVMLGSHRVFNPAGFKGSDFSLRLRGTFASRGFITPIRERFKDWARTIIFVESGSIVSASIPEATDFVVHLANKTSTVYASREDEHLYCKECPWGYANIVSTVAKAFAVDPETAEKIINRYREGRLSDRLHRFIEGLITHEFKGLFEMLETIYTKSKSAPVRPEVYFNFGFSIPPPPALFDKPKIKILELADWLAVQGIEVASSRKHKLDPNLYQSTIALLLHPYFYPHYGFLNQILQRRAKWLIAK